MKRTVNNTGRARIEFDDFGIEVSGSNLGQVLEISMQWDLEHLALQADSELIVYLTGRGLDHRVNMGRFENGKGNFTFRVAEAEENPSIKAEFYVARWDGGIKRILASASPRAVIMGLVSGASTNLLPVKMVSDLTVLWQLDFSTGQPVLEVSNKLLGAVSSSWFKAAVLPVVVRDLFVRFCLTPEDFEENAAAIWKKFFENLNANLDVMETFSQSSGVNSDTLLDVQTAANQVSSTFTTKHNLLDQAVFEIGGN